MIYEYEGTLRHSGFFRYVLKRRLGFDVPEITEFPDRFCLRYDFELTPEQKRILDDAVVENPVPAERIEIFEEPTDREALIADRIKKAIGIEPVRCKSRDGRTILEFDAELAATQEKVIEELPVFAVKKTKRILKGKELKRD